MATFNVGKIMFLSSIGLICQGADSITKLVALTDCVCSGQEVLYQCTVCGQGATTWSGSLFECASRAITLRHMANSEVSGRCNDGAVSARIIEVTGGIGTNCYISQLSVQNQTFGEGKNITCSYVTATSENIVGTMIIKITDQFPPPNNTSISKNDNTPGPVYLTLNWNQKLFNCPSARYIVHTSGTCDVSPNYTVSTKTTISYTNITINEKNCTFSLQTEVCGSLVGRKSDPLMVILKVPHPPVIISTYYFSRDNFVQATFIESDSFFITDGIDGSAISYTTTYVDTLSGIMCGSVTILASSCVGNICTNKYPVSSNNKCPHSTNLTVVVYATNILGNGPESMPVYIGILGDTTHVSTTVDNRYSVGLPTALSLGSASLLLLTLCTVLVFATVSLYRSKTKIKRELQQARDTIKGYTTASYEEISLKVFTSGNIAYGNVHKP